MAKQQQAPAAEAVMADDFDPVPDFEDPFASDLDAAYEQAAPPAAQDYDDLPDGRYHAYTYSVKPFEIGQGKRTGYRGIALQFRVIAGPQRGCKQSHMRSFHPSDQGSMEWLKRDLAALGVEDDMAAGGIKMSQLLAARLDLFLDRVVEIQVKRSPSQTGEPFVNVYINRQLPGVAIPEDLRPGGSGIAAPVATAAAPKGIEF